jgi:hydrogenase-4 component B
LPARQNRRKGTDQVDLVLTAVAIILISGVASLVLHRSPAAATVASVIGIVIGSVVGLVPAVSTLINGGVESLRWSWNVPGGDFSLGLDPLSALFLLVIFIISIPVALYGGSYLWRDRHEHNLGFVWSMTGLLIVSMVMVVVARNAVLFLIAWEVMSLSSFFLVMVDDKKSSAQAAGWTYLVAAHFGTAFLMAFFILMGSGSSFEFGHLTPGAHAGLLFVLCLIGFGTKAGFVPLHIWLPEAHPAAPSHISALMSGVMIKMGIYGIVRSLTFLGPPPEWWGWLLLGIGLVSGVLGVLFALAQHDLKRLLAYHSVENIGIIAIGLGIGLLGMSFHAPLIMVLGFGGGLLHVVNHSLFKGLLFLGAGAVAHSTGTREIDRLGGLLKRMPWTGLAFMVGSIAICGLPPLNGFISEILIYLGALHAGATVEGRMAVAGVAAIGGLALIGGLAVACFTKAFGIVFLGEPRSEQAVDVHEVGAFMKTSMMMLVAGCLAIGLLAPYLVGFLVPAIAQISQLSVESIDSAFVKGTDSLVPIMVAFFVCLGLVAVVALLRWMLLRSKQVDRGPTWDCGYARPTTRMQYNAVSFAQPITRMFRTVLGTRQHLDPPEGFFPKSAELDSHTPDIFRELFFRPVFVGVRKLLEAFRWLQHGNVHLYVLYILITLLALMFWKLR